MDLFLLNLKFVFQFTGFALLDLDYLIGLCEKMSVVAGGQGRSYSVSNRNSTGSKI